MDKQTIKEFQEVYTNMDKLLEITTSVQVQLLEVIKQFGKRLEKIESELNDRKE